MFERFTDRARRVVVLAQHEARALGHNYIGTEHLLLGLTREREAVAGRALESLGISLEAVRAQVEDIIGRGTDKPSEHIPFTPRAKKVLELALREALQLSHNYIGTEHILLGLIREGEGVAAQVLAELGGSLDRVRESVVLTISGTAGPVPSEQVARARAGEAPALMVGGEPGAFLEQEPVELVRVVPLARQVYAGLGVRLVLISLEIWSGWVDVRYALLPEAAPEGPPELLLGWRMADDAGTSYERTGMAAAGGRRLQIAQLGFRPAPPEAARTLTLTVLNGHDPDTPLAVVEVELAAAA
jgi:ClpA/ClpB-like protein